MRFRKLGSSDLEVSEISLGSWLTFSGGVAFEQTRACTDAAFEAGINFFRHGQRLRPGRRRVRVGRDPLGPPRDSYVLATKVWGQMSDDPADQGLSAAQITKQIDASLAGVSIDYYKRLERGNVSGVSDRVLEALARALQLDEAERAHLYDLTRAANPVAPKRRRPVQQRVRPVVQCILDSMAAPALVRNARVDYLAANRLGRALYAPLFESRAQPANSARFTFLDPAAGDFYSDWERVATDLVALRSRAQPVQQGARPPRELDGHTRPSEPRRRRRPSHQPLTTSRRRARRR